MVEYDYAAALELENARLRAWFEKIKTCCGYVLEENKAGVIVKEEGKELRSLATCVIRDCDNALNGDPLQRTPAGDWAAMHV
jgi:hypothetical protein